MEKCMLHKQTVLDPDLSIRRGGVGWGQSLKKMFLPFRPQFSLKYNGGAQAPQGPSSPGSATDKTRRRIN